MALFVSHQKKIIDNGAGDALVRVRKRPRKRPLGLNIYKELRFVLLFR